MDVCLDHDFDLVKVVEEIRKAKARKILVQLPEGFHRCFNSISHALKSSIGNNLEIFLSLNPSYGPCLIDEHTANEINADMIVHFGHVEYPYYRPRVRVLYVPVEYKGVDMHRVKELLASLCREGEKLCIVSTSQHIELCKKLEKELSDCNISYRGTVFGCTHADVRSCSTLLVIAGGRFSCIAQGLQLQSRGSGLRIMCLDPYTYRLWNPAEELVKILRVRMWKVHKALEGKRWLIVSGTYGQSRKELVDMLLNKLREKGFEVDVAKVLRLDRDSIVNIGSSYDVVVVVSCPYQAFDFYDLEVPIITVGEAFMVLAGNIERYIYPW
uniref:2-(3-amino-3-carboxypropyl)histidine synthase n=1 Tax=Ignisphaera aggregans TaxID=334771 RepID=A0A7C2V9D4_9CREN